MSVAPAASRMESVAASVTRLVGDGCVIRRLHPSSGALRAIAGDHRDPDQRLDLALLARGPDLRPPAGGWLRQSLGSNSVVHLTELGPDDLRDLGLPADQRIGDVMIVPIAATPAVIVAVRDRVSGAYTATERSVLQRIAAAAALGLAPPFSPIGMARQLELVSSAVWVTDACGVTTYVNQAACLLVGLPAERLLGVPIAEFIDGVDVQPGQGRFFGEEPVERAVVRDDGATQWLSVAARPLFSPLGKREAILYTLLDITDRHRHETELRMRLDAEQALSGFAELLIVEDEPNRILTSAVELIAEQFEAPLVTAVAVARDRSEVEPLAVAGRLGDLEPDRWRARCELPAASATMAAIEAGEAVRVSDFDAESIYSPGPIARSASARSAACAPISGGAGCLAVLHTEAQGVCDGELELLETVARMVSKRWPAPRRRRPRRLRS